MNAAVHSVSRLVFSVPELDEAQRFYEAFGLDVRRDGDRLDLYTHGHPHRWVSVVANGQAKRLQYLCLGIYAQDEAAFRERVNALGLACEPHPMGDVDGIWLNSPDGYPVQLVVGDKVSPSNKTQPTPPAALARGSAAAPARGQARVVRPRYLSHVLVFTPALPAMLAFCEEVLGLRLSDRSADVIAFTHGAHGSDHHLLALVQSTGPGLHHTSWDVGSLDEVGEGSEQMRKAGFTEGWGMGRHVLGSNYFYYVRDPWGSFAEYSYDIDFIPPGQPWQAGNYPPEDSFYLWGPEPAPWFVANHEHPNPTP